MQRLLRLEIMIVIAALIHLDNIGFNITICYDTPLEKIEKAVATISKILEDHEGMDPEFPRRVYFNEFNADS